VHPVLYLFYYFFKLIVWVSLRVFYSKITVVNEERGRFKNPCIVVSNHPGTLLDPLNAAIEIKTEVFFLANASLFKPAFGNWFFNTFYCIPVERHEDTGGKPLNNKASFESSTAHLAGGGCLYIAPEGTSYVYRRLRKVKTGTARIALAAESRHNFQLGLTILPIGLNYSDPTKFRSELLTLLGEPVRVADFQKDWERDEVEAVQNLTTRIGEALSELILDTKDDDEDKLLACLEEIFQNETRLKPYPAFQRSKSLLILLRDWKAAEPAAFEAFAGQVFFYFEKLKALKISDLTVKYGSGGFAKSVFQLLFAFPVFLLGLLTHFLPVFSAKKLHDWLNKDIHWEATYRYVAGLAAYPLFLGLQIWLVSRVGESWLAWTYVLSILPSGWVAEWWLKQWKLMRERIRQRRLIQNQKTEWEMIRSIRASISEVLNKKNPAV
jgi:glycerol-3-phosphate O-acyltransferase / dihydroxyacetone phosphate acyltransferase